MNAVKDAVLLFAVGVKDCFNVISALRNLGNNPVAKSDETRQRKKESDANVKVHGLFMKVIFAVLLNGTIGIISYLFFNVFLPLARMHSGSRIMCNILTVLFCILWFCPVYLITRIVNYMWYQDIADLSYEISYGKKKNFKLDYLIADNVSSFVIQALFFAQSYAMCLFPPFISCIYKYFHLSILYSLYAFEYKWQYMGLPLKKRLSLIDGKWPYFLGFGLPLVLASSFTESNVYSICIFSFFFPVVIVSGTYSTTVDVQRNYHLNIFRIVIALSDTVSKIICERFLRYRR